MPRGQGKVKGAGQCDASALLNLINYCDCFQSVDLKFVREVKLETRFVCHEGLYEHRHRLYEFEFHKTVKIHSVYVPVLVLSQRPVFITAVSQKYAKHV